MGKFRRMLAERLWLYQRELLLIFTLAAAAVRAGIIPLEAAGAAPVGMAAAEEPISTLGAVAPQPLLSMEQHKPLQMAALGTELPAGVAALVRAVEQAAPAVVQAAVTSMEETEKMCA
ncbi:MAG: hypothetical protein ACU0AY_01085 [Marinibacterium profundimaris]